MVTFCCRPFTNSVKYRDHHLNLPKIWKKPLTEKLSKSSRFVSHGCVISLLQTFCSYITYHPKLKKIAQIMKELEHLLYQDESTKQVFTPPPMVFYRNARKLSSYLVCAKLYPLERKRGSYKCGSLRCLVCNNIKETDTFTSTVTGESFKVNHHLFCHGKCLIYLLTCKVCTKQYTGKISENLDYNGTTIKKDLKPLIIICSNTTSQIMSFSSEYIFMPLWRTIKNSG